MITGHCNLRHMREGYSSRHVCVCVCVCLSVCLSICLSVYLSVCQSVCYQTSCYIPRFYIESQVSLGFLCCFQHTCMYCVNFDENTLFWTSKVLATFADQLCFLTSSQWTKGQQLMGYFQENCRTSNSSYNSTDSSLVTADYQPRMLLGI